MWSSATEKKAVAFNNYMPSLAEKASMENSKTQQKKISMEWRGVFRFQKMEFLQSLSCFGTITRTFKMPHPREKLKQGKSQANKTRLTSYFAPWTNECSLLWLTGQYFQCYATEGSTEYYWMYYSQQHLFIQSFGVVQGVGGCYGVTHFLME